MIKLASQAKTICSKTMFLRRLRAVLLETISYCLAKPILSRAIMKCQYLLASRLKRHPNKIYDLLNCMNIQ